MKVQEKFAESLVKSIGTFFRKCIPLKIKILLVSHENVQIKQMLFLSFIYFIRKSSFPLDFFSPV